MQTWLFSRIGQVQASENNRLCSPTLAFETDQWTTLSILDVARSMSGKGAEETDVTSH